MEDDGPGKAKGRFLSFFILSFVLMPFLRNFFLSCSLSHSLPLAFSISLSLSVCVWVYLCIGTAFTTEERKGKRDGLAGKCLLPLSPSPSFLLPWRFLRYFSVSFSVLWGGNPSARQQGGKEPENKFGVVQYRRGFAPSYLFQKIKAKDNSLRGGKKAFHFLFIFTVFLFLFFLFFNVHFLFRIRLLVQYVCPKISRQKFF
jgi:hypothetical protein